MDMPPAPARRIQDLDVPASRTQGARYIAYSPEHYEETDSIISLKLSINISVELR